MVRPGALRAHVCEQPSSRWQRPELGDKFPKHIYHSIICIGALVAHREECGRWTVDALGAPHVGERPEKELISSFVDKIAVLSPQLVTFNGSSFDLPVLRYRAMVHGVAAPGLAPRQYFHRYTEDAVDLCDVLSSFTSQAKASLHELCRVMGLPGKPDGMIGAEATFAGDLPHYEDNLRVKVTDVTTKLKRRGNLADGFGCP